MKLRIAALLLTLPLALAACGKKDGDDAKEPARIHEASVHCAGLPDFAVLYADAVVTGCFQGASTVSPNRESGTVIYTTKATPEVVLSWYREQAAVKALSEGPAAPTSFSAHDDGLKRTMMVMTAAQPQGTQVTLNWGRDK